MGVSILIVMGGKYKDGIWMDKCAITEISPQQRVERRVDVGRVNQGKISLLGM